MRQRLFIFILFFILLKPVFSQQQIGPYMAYGPEAKYFSILNFTVNQSKAGFLRIGTQNGLVRFDSKRYKIFFLDYTNSYSLYDNNIPDIVEDKNGDLWFFGFFNGLTKYNESTGIFKKFTNPAAHNKPNHLVNWLKPLKKRLHLLLILKSNLLIPVKN